MYDLENILVIVVCGMNLFPYSGITNLDWVPHSSLTNLHQLPHSVIANLDLVLRSGMLTIWV